jgi:prepilin peptidase dependent protein B
MGTMANRRTTASGQRGLSVVELMVGLTVGLIVIAAAASVFAQQVQHTRREVIEARLQQDLRAVAVLLERYLRRAGHWQAALRHTQWPAENNPYREVSVSVAPQAVSYSYSRDDDGDNGVVDSHEQFGFRLAQQVLHTRAGTGQWQSLTDRQVVRITRLQLELDAVPVQADHACLRSCTGTADTCPQATVRLVRYTIEAQAAPPYADVRHRIRGATRVRNDRTQAVAC